MSRLKRFMLVSGVAAMLALFVMLPAQSDELAQAGRQIATKWQNCIVTVQIVVSTSVSYEGKEGPKEESKSEVDGCIIDPSGLVVTSLSYTNPEEMYGEMMGEQSEDYKVTSEIKDVKLLMLDGQELPAKIVLRDKEQDLAFIRPTQKPAKPIAALDLTKGAAPLLFDPIISLSRQTVVGNRSTAISLDRVETILEKPRTFYIPDTGLDFGAAVFAADGTFIGVAVNKKLAPGAAATNMYDTSMGVILPAADIAEAAKQAPAEAK